MAIYIYPNHRRARTTSAVLCYIRLWTGHMVDAKWVGGDLEKRCNKKSSYELNETRFSKKKEFSLSLPRKVG